MNAIRTLTTLAAAVTLVSGIGFVYAQSTDTTPAPAATTSADMKAPATSAKPSPSADTGSTAKPAAAATDNTAAPVERAAKADRG